MLPRRTHYSPFLHQTRGGTINRNRIKQDIIVIGASAGGVPALQQILADFPAHFAVRCGRCAPPGRGPKPEPQDGGRAIQDRDISGIRQRAAPPGWFVGAGSHEPLLGPFP
jgi:hypothetical protein